MSRGQNTLREVMSAHLPPAHLAARGAFLVTLRDVKLEAVETLLFISGEAAPALRRDAREDQRIRW